MTTCFDLHTGCKGDGFVVVVRIIYHIAVDQCVCTIDIFTSLMWCSTVESGKDVEHIFTKLLKKWSEGCVFEGGEEKMGPFGISSLTRSCLREEH